MKKSYDNSAWNKLILERQNSNHGFDAVNRDYTTLQLSAMRTISSFYGVLHIYDTYLVDGFIMYVVTVGTGKMFKFSISPLGVYTKSLVPGMISSRSPAISKVKKKSTPTQLNLFK